MKMNPLGMFFVLGVILTVWVPLGCRAMDGSFKPFLMGAGFAVLLFGSIAAIVAVAIYLEVL